MAERPGYVVLNVDASESDPTPLSQERFASAVGRLAQAAEREAEVTAGEQEAIQRMWRYTLMLMAVVLLAEGWWGRRMMA